MIVALLTVRCQFRFYPMANIVRRGTTTSNHEAEREPESSTALPLFPFPIRPTQ